MVNMGRNLHDMVVGVASKVKPVHVIFHADMVARLLNQKQVTYNKTSSCLPGSFFETYYLLTELCFQERGWIPK